MQTSTSNEEKKTLSVALEQTSEKPKPIQVPYGPLSTDLGTHLLCLTKEATAKNVTPVTIDAACKVANTLLRLMELNFKMRGKE